MPKIPGFSNFLVNFVYKALREKCPNTEFFLVLIFPHTDWIGRDTKCLSVFSPNAGKYGPEKTSYLDTFHAVNVSRQPTMLISTSSDVAKDLEFDRLDFIDNLLRFFVTIWRRVYYVIGLTEVALQSTKYNYKAT